jgi:hypothetical protein
VKKFLKEEKRVCVSFPMGYSNHMNEITEAQKLAIAKITAWEKQMSELDSYDEIADALEHERDALEARWDDAKYHGAH